VPGDVAVALDATVHQVVRVAREIAPEGRVLADDGRRRLAIERASLAESAENVRVPSPCVGAPYAQSTAAGKRRRACAARAG
jgi:hypothetical protein